MFGMRSTGAVPIVLPLGTEIVGAAGAEGAEGAEGADEIAVHTAYNVVLEVKA
jgi:hypothetical protein